MLVTVPALIAFVIIYLLVLFFYGNSTRLDISGAGEGISTSPDSVQVVLDISKVDATASLVSGTMQVYAEAQADENLELTQDITVDLVTSNASADATVSPRPQVRTFSATFEKGRSAFGLSVPVELRPDGDYQTYPFDTMSTQVLAFVTVGSRQSAVGEIPVNLLIVGDVPGWLIRDQPLMGDDGQDILTELEDDGLTSAGRFATGLYLARAGSTKTFVLLLLVAMIVLGVLSLLVARAVRTKRRRIEATMASWFAAMLFAVIPLRLNMPGSPPIGVWIDFMVLLWVELALMIGLAVFVGSWLRYTRPPEPTPQDSTVEPAGSGAQ